MNNEKENIEKELSQLDEQDILKEAGKVGAEKPERKPEEVTEADAEGTVTEPMESETADAERTGAEPAEAAEADADGAEPVETEIAEGTEADNELPELVFAEDLFLTDEEDIPEADKTAEAAVFGMDIDRDAPMDAPMDAEAEEDLFLGVDAALTEQIENEFGSGLATTEEKKKSGFIKGIPTWTKVLIIVILVILLSVGFLFGTKPGQMIISRIIVEIILGGANVVPDETPTPFPTEALPATPGITEGVTPEPTPTPTGAPTGEPVTPEATPTPTLTPTPTPIHIMDSEDVINILLLGEENIFGAKRGRTDAILVASLNKKTGEIGLVSFLRDTYVSIPGHPDDRLNAAYGNGGASLVMQTIEQNFQIDIDSYVLINFSGFENVIDDLGGLKISLTAAESEFLNTTRYVSKPEERNTVAGMQTMTGSQVLGYCRIRQVPTASGLRDDYGRNYRHRVVLQALFDKYKEKGYVELLNTLNQCMGYVTVPESFKGLAAECLQVVIDKLALEFDTLQMPASGYREAKKIGGKDVIVFYPQNVDILQEFLYGEAAEP